MMEWSTPETILYVIQSWEEVQAVIQKELNSLGTGQRAIYEVQESCTWGGTIPCPNTNWPPAVWKQALQRETYVLVNIKQLCYSGKKVLHSVSSYVFC